MKLSGTSLRSLMYAVVVANEPMPSASKKFVTAPTPIDSTFGLSCRRLADTRRISVVNTKPMPYSMCELLKTPASA